MPTSASLNAAAEDADDLVDTGPKTVFEDVVSLLGLALPFTAGQMVFLIGAVVQTVYLGHIDASALAASGLAMTWMSVTSVLSNAMSSGIVVLASQAFGQEGDGGEPNHASLIFLRGLLLTFILTAITGASWFFTYYFAKVSGATEEVALMANQFSMTMLIGMPASTWSNCFVQYLCAQDIGFPPLVASIVAIPVNIGCGYLFIFTFGWGFIGAPLAQCASSWVALVAMTGYHVYSHEEGFSNIYKGWDVSKALSWDGMKSYCAIALPNASGIIMEELAFDGIIVMAAMCPNSTHVVAATNVILTIYNFWYMVGFCISNTVSSRVGAGLGKADVPGAKKGAVAGAIVTAIPQIIFTVVLVVAAEPVAGVFTSDKNVAHLAASGLIVAVIGNGMDAIVSLVAMGILMGMGKAEVIAYSKAAMLVTVLPACYYFGVYKTEDDAGHVRGLWWGWLIGICSCFLVAMYFLCVSDWDAAVALAKERMEADHEDEETGDADKKEATAQCQPSTESDIQIRAP